MSLLPIKLVSTFSLSLHEDREEPVEQLIQTLRTYKALFVEDAVLLFRQEVVVSADEQRLLRKQETEYGQIVSLSLRGRKRAGLVGEYKPTEKALLNAAALSRVACALRRSGYEVECGPRRHVLVATHHQHRFIALARYTGFQASSVRTLAEEMPAISDARNLRIYVPNEFYRDLSGRRWDGLHSDLHISIHRIPARPRSRPLA